MSDAPAPKPQQPQPRTQTIELQTGMVAEVMSPDNRLIFVGRIEKIRDNGIYIREANDDTLPMALVNRPVKVRFYRETDNVVLNGKVCGSTIHMWKIDRLESTFAREKRGFFRQSISVDVKAECGKCPDKGGSPEAYFPCQVLDISAGGILIDCAEAFSENDSLIIREARLMANTPPFTFHCQVRRAGEWQKGVYHYGCQFESLSAKDQDRLLQAIFTIQREEIRKRRARR